MFIIKNNKILNFYKSLKKKLNTAKLNLKFHQLAETFFTMNLFAIYF